MTTTSMIKTLIVILFFPVVSMGQQALVIELQRSEDLTSWAVVPLEAQALNEGKLRLNEEEPSVYYRLRIVTPAVAAAEKILAYIESAGNDSPPSEQDYLDLGVNNLDVGYLTELNSQVLSFEGDPGNLSLFAQEKVDDLNLLNLDPVALAYGQRVGLVGEPVMKISSFLKELSADDIHPVWLVLGRSEFLALEGTDCRSVIGPDGNVLGSISTAVEGMKFDGLAGTRIEFPNPSQSSSVSDYSVWCHASSEDEARRGVLVSAYRGNDDRGPELTFGGAPGLPLLNGQVSAFVSPGNTETSNRSSIMPQVIPGVRKMSGWSFAGSAPETVTGRATLRPFNVHKDLYSLNSSNETPEFYNNGSTWSLGARPGGGNELIGEIDLALACDHPLTTAQRDQLHAAALKHGIVSTSKPFALIAVGDSMTTGQVGGVSIGEARTAQLMARQSGGWQGGIYTNEAKGGQSVSVQEGFYEIAKTRLLRYPPEIKKIVLFWGGYNPEAGVDVTVKADREAWIERYIAMGVDAKANGIESYHWSKLTGGGNTPGDAISVANEAWNDYYAMRCAEEGLHWYDHRLTFSRSEFDANIRNENFFVDGRHLSKLGQETLVADFIIRFPSPYDPAEDLSE